MTTSVRRSVSDLRPTKHRDQSTNVLGRLRLEGHLVARDRVDKAETHGVQGLTGKVAAGRQGFRPVDISPLASGIERVSYEGVALVGHVDTNLVGATGYEPAVDQTRSIPALTHRVESSRRPAVSDDGHPLTVLGVAVDGRIDDAFRFLKGAVAHGEIGLFHRASPECQRQGLVGSIGLGHDQKTGGVLVQTVDDPGPRDPTDTGQIVTVVKEGVDQRAAGVAGGRVNDQARGFVDDQKLGILVHDRKRQVFGREIENLRLGLVDNQSITVGDQGGRFRRAVVVAHPIVVDQPPNPRPRPFLREIGETTIETTSRQFRGNGEGVYATHLCPRRLIHRCTAIPTMTRPEEISWLVETRP